MEIKGLPAKVPVLGRMPANLLLVPKSDIFTTPLKFGFGRTVLV